MLLHTKMSLRLSCQFKVLTHLGLRMKAHAGGLHTDLRLEARITTKLCQLFVPTVAGFHHHTSDIGGCRIVGFLRGRTKDKERIGFVLSAATSLSM